MTQLDGILGDFPLIINTVPAMLLDEAKLKSVRHDALVLDLASKPGGDDIGDTYSKHKGRDRMKNGTWSNQLHAVCSGLLILCAGIAALIMYKKDQPATYIDGKVEISVTDTGTTAPPETAPAQTSSASAAPQTAETTTYLVTETPDRNLNTADAAALRRVSGVGDILADAIIAYRTEIGGFTRRAQLLEVSGIGEVLASRIMAEFEIPDELPPEVPKLPQPVQTEPPPPEPEIPPPEPEIPQESPPEPPAKREINQITFEELMQIPKMTEELASAILELRTKLGRIDGIYMLVLIEDLDGAYFEEVLREYLYAENDPLDAAQPMRESAAG